MDGSTAADLEAQLGKVPAEATHIVISVGSNDAILNSDLLDLPVTSTAEALDVFGLDRRACYSSRASYRTRLSRFWVPQFSALSVSLRARLITDAYMGT